MFNANPLDPLDRRVLVLLSLGRDSELACRALNEAKIRAQPVGSIQELCREIQAGAGTILLGFETLSEKALVSLAEVLRRQPPWSDLPFVVFSRLGDADVHSETMNTHLAPIGNFTLIDRPVRRTTLVTTVAAALRARERQYATRRLLTQQAFLSRASAELSSSLDANTTLERFAGLAVPRLGDWCLISVGASELVSERRVVAHAHSPASSLEWMPSSFPEKPVLRRGDEEEDQADDYVRLIRQVKGRSGAVLPLFIGGKSLGSIMLIWAETDRRYEPQDMPFLTELAHRVALAVENTTLYESVRSAVEVRDQFLSIAGHELKTPLAALLMQVQSVERLVPEGGRVRERLQKASMAGVRLETLINQLLDVSRIRAGRLQLEPEPVDLAALAQEVVERQISNALQMGTTIQFQTRGQVHGLWDRFRLDQVITNLLTNAIKYGCGKPVEVHVHADQGRGLVRVTDHGIGIAPEQQARIFQRFERAVEARRYGGFGLGLWIARQIVEASGGEIQVQSQLGEGSTFIVTLPTSSGPEAHHAHAF